ncbi:hypothetical protein Dsin_011325 [Dipteronia sinensis]|uniref:C2H2-type domain-containing protein n=1 Tax=Dipteronia sinensis TaxID=43782 RepID=A0AAE0AUU7_9ROSI|nr:hypothetical protein Dsin_011325 [Dipteronia sinensis]
MSFQRRKDSRINENYSGEWLSLGNKKAYPCLLCEKTFDTGPALGGHQNAHRKEREEAANIWMCNLIILSKENQLRKI